MGFPGGSVVKNLPANAELQEMWAQSLCQEDSLEEEIATHSSILVWKMPWTEEPGRLHSPWGHKRVRYDWVIEHRQGYFCNVTKRVPGSASTVTTNVYNILNIYNVGMHGFWINECVVNNEHLKWVTVNIFNIYSCNACWWFDLLFLFIFQDLDN